MSEDAKESHRISITLIGFAALAILVSALCLTSFLTESFWLDETITVWVARAAPDVVVSRAIDYQGQSPLYYLLVAGWAQLFGWTEVSLRMISLTFLVGTVFITMKLAQRIGIGPYAPLSALLLLSIDPVLVSLSARPYAMALFLATLSFYWLLKIEQTPRVALFVGYTFSIAATGYTHYLFLLVIIPQLMLILVFPRNSRFYALGSLSVAALAMLPMLPQLLSLWRRAPDLSFAEPPTLLGLFAQLVPPYLVLYLCVGLALGYLWSKGTTFRLAELRSVNLKRLGTLILVVPCLLAGIAWLGGPALTVERYYLWIYPFVALGLAGMLGALSTQQARVVAILAIVLFASSREFGRRWQVEEWRGAARLLEEAVSDAPVIAYTGLIESRVPEYLSDQKHHEYLAAPLRVYGVQGAVIPVASKPPQEETLRGRLREETASASRVRFVYFEPGEQTASPSAGVNEWIRFFQSFGFMNVEVILAKGQIRALLFSRNSNDSLPNGDRP